MGTQEVQSFVAFGANLGDREGNMRGGAQALSHEEGVRLVAASPLYVTAPVGGPSGQLAFLNAVVEIRTTLPAHVLLQRLQKIEACFGRTREIYWGPRTLDLDILFYGQDVLSMEHLIVPHPRLHQRHFVLAPLSDIAADIVHPIFRKTVAELLDALPKVDPTEVASLTKEWIHHADIT